MYLIVVDTMQIQPYIFGSNRLRENLGASYLVAQATEDWAWDHLPKPNNRDLQNVFSNEQINAPNSTRAPALHYNCITFDFFRKH